MDGYVQCCLNEKEKEREKKRKKEREIERKERERERVLYQREHNLMDQLFERRGWQSESLPLLPLPPPTLVFTNCYGRWPAYQTPAAGLYSPTEGGRARIGCCRGGGGQPCIV